MYVPQADAGGGEEEWRTFVDAQGFGHLVATGAGLDYPVVVPTQFVLEGMHVLAHFAVHNPVVAALSANPKALLSVAGDWAFIPSDWKALDGEDPTLGIPTTYYGAVQLKGRAQVIEAPDGVASVLRRQLSALQPATHIADPESAHAPELRAIRAVVLEIDEVIAKFKYGGNVDEEHRRAVIARLRDRRLPGDLGAVAHIERRLAPPSR
jgi:transcriptional regulator